MKTLGVKISELRKAKNLTQEELANQLNVSYQAVSKWENDLSIPDLPTLIQLSELFNVSLDDLVKERQQVVTYVEPKQQKSIDQLFLRVRVLSAEGDKVNVNLPLQLVKVAYDMGLNFSDMTNNPHAKSIDLEMIMKLIEKGAIGKLVDIQSADGDIVEVIVE